ncbi:hypothetical protein Leryth_004154 [Lithospermum erythrorhizon]|nr:hypothetical protein Leryth_004154 [Lithospermum erythrorhizon]
MIIVSFLYLANLFLGCLSFDNFVFNGFNASNLVRDGSTIVKPSGVLKLTNDSKHVTGHAFFPTPIRLLNNSSSPSSSSSPSNASSFSTTFVFLIVPSSDKNGGYGLAFTLSPSPKFEGAQGDHYLGIFNDSNDGNPSNSIFLVEFDTVDGHNEDSDTEGNHIGVNNNGMNSIATEPASYHVNGTNNKEEVDLQGGKPIQAWIDYDGLQKIVNVTIAPMSERKPVLPLISQGIDLSSVVKENMYAGFSAATGEKASSHYILGWSFSVNGVAEPLDLSKLPIPPTEKKSNSETPLTKTLIATLSVSLCILVGGLVATVYRRVRNFEVLEEWELDSPHRFRYKDLHTATKGFKSTELIGAGGFGEVYKGVLPSNDAEVAVKKISNNSRQGLREFVAEIESLGRLRHKNLVNLQGWCKLKNELLLVYDYIPNGSLDSLLYNLTHDVVLTWEQRFHIIEGVAAGLLYLHEEWEQVVIHRDVKSSNVLIDREMNARLGDFGLARLHDHDKASHTTHVVGTIGYIAPELTRTGKASTSSDVYAYGILLLEVVCGKPPVRYHPEHGQVILMDWVIECLHLGQLLDAIDPKLSSQYDSFAEMELVLGLGLLCSHPRQEARPTIRQVLAYLNRDEALPVFNKLSSVGSRSIEDVTSGYSEFMTTEITTTSYGSSSVRRLSMNSFGTTRS